MKPRSKIECRYTEMADSLPQVNEQVAEWAKTLFDDIALFWKHRGNNQEIWCQCCGHREPCDSWLVMSLSGYQCPVCGKNLEVKNIKESMQNEGRWITVVDTYKGEQVIRVFNASRSNYRNSPTHYGMSEIYQIWITECGREIITTRGYTRSYNFINWNYGGKYQIGRHGGSHSGYYYYDDVYSPSDNYIYPKMKFAPYMRRAKIGKVFTQTLLKRRIRIEKAFSYLVKFKTVETLLKTGYDKLYWFLLADGRDFSKYRHSVNICHRNRYVIANPDLWLDYIDNLIELGLDTHNAHYVCPPNLIEAHNQMVVRVNKKRAKEKYIRDLEMARKDEAKYMKNKGRFFPIRFSGSGYTIVCISSVSDVAREGAVLHHCVFANKYYDKENSLLLSARDKDNNPIETAEIDLRSFEIRQCRGEVQSG